MILPKPPSEQTQKRQNSSGNLQKAPRIKSNSPQIKKQKSNLMGNDLSSYVQPPNFSKNTPGGGTSGGHRRSVSKDSGQQFNISTDLQSRNSKIAGPKSGNQTTNHKKQMSYGGYSNATGLMLGMNAPPSQTLGGLIRPSTEQMKQIGKQKKRIDNDKYANGHTRKYSGKNVSSLLESTKDPLNPVGPIEPPLSAPGNQGSVGKFKKLENNITKFSFATKTGIVPSNPNKQNQDAYITVPHFCGQKYIHYFGVCDGHGQFGQDVSGFIKVFLPQVLEQFIAVQLQQLPHLTYLDSDQVKKALEQSYMLTHQEVQSQLDNTQFSGSTCVTLLAYANRFYCANAGDSRAILARKTENTEVVPLSYDHKPEYKEEALRIKNTNGRIDSFRDMKGNPIGPLRVWLKEQDVPGLAMTRSIGDLVAQSVGVTAFPDVIEVTLTKDDKFIVIASDGVWEFLSNEQVADIVWPFYEKKNAEGAAEALVRKSYNRWKEEEEVIDDITCIVIFLDVKIPIQQ